MKLELVKEVDGSELGVSLSSVMDMCLVGAENVLLVSNLHNEQSLAEDRKNPDLEPGVITLDSKLVHGEFRPLDLGNPWSIHVPDDNQGISAYIGDRGRDVIRDYMLPDFTNPHPQPIPVKDPAKIAGYSDNLFVLETDHCSGSRLGTVRQVKGSGIEDIPGVIDICSYGNIVYAMRKTDDGFKIVEVGRRPRGKNHAPLEFPDSDYRQFSVGNDLALVFCKRKLEKPRVIILDSGHSEEAELQLNELKGAALGSYNFIYAHGFKAKGKGVKHVVQLYEVKEK